MPWLLKQKSTKNLRIWVIGFSEIHPLLYSIPKSEIKCEYPNWGAGVWVGAQVDPLSALGVTKAKRRVSKKTGIPMSRGGRVNSSAIEFGG